MIMEFVLSEQKANELGYPVEACYDVIDRLFAEYGIKPEKQGFYRGPDVQNTYNACSAALHRLPASSWFLKVIKEWYWRFKSDEVEAREDCLRSYYSTHQRKTQ